MLKAALRSYIEGSQRDCVLLLASHPQATNGPTYLQREELMGSGAPGGNLGQLRIVPHPRISAVHHLLLHLELGQCPVLRGSRCVLSRCGMVMESSQHCNQSLFQGGS